MSAALQLPKVDYDLIRLEGGLDQLTPSVSIPPGRLRDAQNFEISLYGGYTRVAGYERFDGRPSPSAAGWGAIVLNAVANVVVGETINDGANTAVVIAITGTTIVYTKQVGSFTVAGTILKSGLTVGTVTAISAIFDAKTQAQYRALAAAKYRADIAAVPGSGPIRGVAAFNGNVYAWRDNAGGTLLTMYVSTTLGWVQVTMPQELFYDTGSAEIDEGATIVGAITGATAIVRRQLVTSGTVGSSTATGSLIITDVVGLFQPGEQLMVGLAAVAMTTSYNQSIPLKPGGRVRVVDGNFGSGRRLYGCDGVNTAFEFDGTYYVPIRTGMAVDTPSGVAVHSGCLFLAFGASLQFSSTNSPYTWSPILGAGEIVMREDITNMMSIIGSDQSAALVLYGLETTAVLYGTSALDFKLVLFSHGVGANADTAQLMDSVYVYDERGVMSLTTAFKFGNFDSATLTNAIGPWIQSRRTTSTTGGLNRERSQYRVFFADGSALYLTIVDGKFLGSMPIQFPDPVLVWTDGDVGSATESSFFGAANGFVYRMDVGSSFDGQNIDAWLKFATNHSKSPRIRKRYRRASIEVGGSSYAEFSFGYDIGYDPLVNSQPDDVTYASNFRSNNWDDSLTWDTLVWDGVTVSPSEVEMAGTAENVALRIACDADYIDEFTINSAIVHYSTRRGIR